MLALYGRCPPPHQWLMVLKNILIAFVLSVTVLSNTLIGGGVLWDENDLVEWRDRAVNGPYKSSGDAFDSLIPGEWARIVANKKYICL